MPELQRLRADHAEAVLAFELANRTYFAASISDRGDEFFEDFAERHDARVAEQDAGFGAYYLLVTDDGRIMGRFNLIFAGTPPPNSATELRRNSQDRDSPLGLCGNSVGSHHRSTACTQSGRPPPSRTSDHRRCSSKRASSQSDQPIRHISAVGRATGTSAIWTDNHSLRGSLSDIRRAAISCASCRLKPAPMQFARTALVCVANWVGDEVAMRWVGSAVDGAPGPIVLLAGRVQLGVGHQRAVKG